MTATSESAKPPQIGNTFDNRNIFSILTFRLKASVHHKTAKLVICAEMVNMLLLAQ